MEKCEINKNIETTKTSNTVINTCSEEQIQNLRDIQANNFITQSMEEINNLKRQLKITEEDRDLSKQTNVYMIGMCLEIFKLDDVKEIKDKVDETIKKCNEEVLKSLK